MKTALAAIILFLTTPAFADDVTVTWDVNEQAMFDTLCEELRLTRADPDAPWGPKRCLGRFAKRGMRSFKREQSAMTHTINSKILLQQDMNEFDGVFPEEP
jgi:hypothetical protein